MLMHALEEDGPIVCKLTPEALSAQPEYEALSYTWSLSGNCLDITRNNVPLPARENTTIALRRLRLPSRPRTLWIDAICINQDGDVERAQ
jgi:hypothetical protein